MSRVGKYPVKLADGVSVEVSDEVVTVKGKLGSLTTPNSKLVKVTVADNQVVVEPVSGSREARMMWGTMRANINNLVKGVTEGYKRKLELVGVGYKAAVQGTKINLSLGFSHEVNYQLPEGVKAVCPDQTTIELSGMDKIILGKIASELRAYRKPEPYKGKGVKYAEEVVLRKEGKKK